MQVRLADPIDLDGFRRQARQLLAAGVPPQEVQWCEGPGQSLFDDDSAPMPALRPAAPAPRVPAAFVELCRRLILHRDPQRLDLLYRLLWRLAHEPALRHDPLDADLLQAQRMARAVARDIHKMRAFVRFTRVAEGEGGAERHVAWFEPEHRIVEANAPFFMRRFAQMRWAILTPQRCVAWDGHALRMEPGADASARPPPDAGEALWLTYYEHIFNPARLKLAMMRREMPVRYWKNLPEAALIAPLSAAAQQRSQAMIEAPATEPRRIRAPQPIHLLPAAGSAPASLEELRAAAHACRACPIGALATQAVCGEGPRAAARMLVGEQPGDQEDLAGRPFVGPAGQLLDRAMAELGWPRESVYLANAVRHFKFELRGKRRMHKTAGQREALACAPWLGHEIDLVQPQALVALGATAARTLLGRSVAVQAERGRWLHERADGRAVLVTLHPSALLRLPEAHRPAAYRQWLADLALARAPVA
ncbi:UdgX family uracil-DNA binding protein [Xenophilus arseniciresistens]|uniref:Type-4 uracil-DNA glycosylase n=1 Tax=Xenophilus arseniciresistens TaxID=1283306 RepID=A0AAE3T1C3_9BURK|nr:UdgX family uracil-DNA binding protein [Xenophilus arseniciresistens]MDA7417846.1 UdgX family uracil-DNA binding protein [Xenophilus arseniciresistens]